MNMQEDSLEFLEKLFGKHHIADNTKPFHILAALTAFRRVVRRCFAKERKPNFKNAIADFRTAILRIGAKRISTKVCSFDIEKTEISSLFFLRGYAFRM